MKWADASQYQGLTVVDIFRISAISGTLLSIVVKMNFTAYSTLYDTLKKHIALKTDTPLGITSKSATCAYFCQTAGVMKRRSITTMSNELNRWEGVAGSI